LDTLSLHDALPIYNTIEEFPQWLFKVKIGKQGTFKVKFQEKSKMRSGLNFSRS
jgi:hypothetical protein